MGYECLFRVEKDMQFIEDLNPSTCDVAVFYHVHDF